MREGYKEGQWRLPEIISIFGFSSFCSSGKLATGCWELSPATTGQDRGHGNVGNQYWRQLYI